MQLVVLGGKAPGLLHMVSSTAPFFNPKMAQTEFYGGAVATLPIQFILVYDISRGILQPVVASINALLSLLTLMFIWVPSPLFVSNSIGDQY